MANRITEQLIRKKSEHNDGLLGDLQELTLHQCELGRLEVVGTLCRKLQILYLQNNVIPKIENVEHLKDLRYLNLALNNVKKIEGLQNCEFLNKLDLTVNFVDLDAYEASVEHLSQLHALREIFLMGNPCTEWAGHRPYLVARCPQITTIDGKEVTRSERILAAQALERLSKELRRLAAAKRAEKRRAEDAQARKKAARHGVVESKSGGVIVEDIGSDEEDDGGDDRCDWTPEVRLEMAEEQAEQKRKEEERKREMSAPERDYEREHQEKVAKVKELEAAVEAKKVRQCNEGRYEFHLEDEDGKGNVVLTIPLPRHLDTCLLDVDVHPTYITVVIKGKVLRLHLPEEVKPDAGNAQRSRTTGALVVTMPKEKPNLRLARRLKQAQLEAEEARKAAEEAEKAARRAKLPPKIGDAMMNAAGATASQSVDVKNIVKRDNAGAGGGGAAMTARTTTRTGGEVEEKGSEVEAQHTHAAEATPARRRGPLVQEDGPRGTMVADDDDGSDWEDDADVPPLE